MSTTAKLFDRYKAALGSPSDRQAAKMLGVKIQTVSNWRVRGSQAEPWTIEKMCAQLNEDSLSWLLRAQAEQAHDPINGLVWQRLATRLGVALSAVAWMAADSMSDGTMSGIVAAIG